MNWVGGSRKRILLTKEKRKQKDFFEKEKLKSKMKLMGLSSQKSSAVSLDLLNLYVVNQISTQKSNTDRVQKPVHAEINRGIKTPSRRYNVEFPKSPEHRLLKPFLDDVQHRVQQEVLENRKKYLLERSFQSQSLRGSLPEEEEFHLPVDGQQRQGKSGLPWVEVPQSTRMGLQSSQLSNMKHKDLWLPKSACNQEEFTSPGTGGTAGDQYSQQLNTIEYSKTSPNSPQFAPDTYLENNHREDPLLSVMNDTLKTTQDESSQTIAELSEEDNQPFMNISSSPSCHSFANKHILDQLFKDTGDAKQISNIFCLYNKEEMQQKTSRDRHSGERNLKGVLTGPNQISFSSNQSLNGTGPETITNQLKDYYIEEKNPVIHSDQQATTMNFKNLGGTEKQKKNMKVTDPVKNFMKEIRNDGLTEQKLNQLQIFGPEETETEVFRCCDQQSKQGTKYDDDESQLNNWSPSYSPKQTDEYFSTTSSEQSEKEEEEALNDFQDPFLRSQGGSVSVSGRQTTWCNCQSRDMYYNLHESLSQETADLHPQTKPALGLRKDKLCTAGTELSEILFENTYADFKPQHDAWSQTETYRRDITTKSDASVQCNIMQACGCKNELSSVHSAEIVTSTSKVETTGGQNIPADKAPFQPSCSSNLMFMKSIAPQTEYFVVHGKIRPGKIDFIGVMSERETCD